MFFLLDGQCLGLTPLHYRMIFKGTKVPRAFANDCPMNDTEHGNISTYLERHEPKVLYSIQRRQANKLTQQSALNMIQCPKVRRSCMVDRWSPVLCIAQYMSLIEAS